MATDIQDWSSAVTVLGGSVTISGIATVTISGTPAVTISGTPAVTVSSGTVSISGTVNVSITGSNTVVLGGGVATIGAISAINSSVTVAGTVNIGNTPAVTISSGTVNIGNSPTVNIGLGPADVTAGPTALGALDAAVSVATAGLQGVGMQLAAGTLIGTISAEVSMDGGTTWVGSTFINPADQSAAVSIVFASSNPATTRSILTPAGTTNARVRVSAYTSGTANCTLKATASQSVNIIIAGTPTVNIGNTPSVSISGTPNVNISSGTVAISGTPNINIQSQSITVATLQTQQTLADLTFPAGTSTQTTATVPAGCQALMLINGSLNTFSGVQVFGHSSNTLYLPVDTAQGNIALVGQSIMVIPIVSVLDTTYDVVATNPTGGNLTIKVIALFGPQSVWAQSTGRQPVFAWTQVRPFNFQAFHEPGAGVAGSVIAAASLNGRWLVSLVRGSLTAGGTAGAVAVQIKDGAAQKFSEAMGVIATASSTDHAGFDHGAFVGTFNTAMNVITNAGLAGAFVRLGVGMHLIGG